MTNANIRSINSARPFVDFVDEYREKGWFGAIPLPRKEKSPPPTGFTGRKNDRYPTQSDIDEWKASVKYKNGNIGLRFGFPVEINGKVYEVIGLDVDHYNGKKGGDTLKKLEKRLGELPETYIISARNDGISGIRLFLVPIGFAYRDDTIDIDIIQRVHRYAVTYPSYNPDSQSVYRFSFGRSNTAIWDAIPRVEALPILPKRWVNFLTRNGVKDDKTFEIDMSSTDRELDAWVEENFPDGSGECCDFIEKRVSLFVDRVVNGSEHHYPLRGFHFNVLNTVAEGWHPGWKEAIERFNKVWVADALDKGKRDFTTARLEVQRSYYGALRRVKGKIEASGIKHEHACDLYKADLEGVELDSDGEIVLSVETISPEPVEGGEGNGLGAGTGDGASVSELEGSNGGSGLERTVERRKGKAPRWYENVDDSQAQHFHDIYQGNIKWISNWKSWIVYDASTGCWVMDNQGIAKALFRFGVVEKYRRWQKYYHGRAEAEAAVNGKQNNQKYKEWVRWSDHCHKMIATYSNVGKSDAALKVYQSFPGVSMRYEELNEDHHLIAMANGKCIRLLSDGYRIEDNAKENYITLNTGFEWVDSADEYGVRKWEEYLELLLPDASTRRDFRKAVGSSLVGGNPERYVYWLIGGTSTGKSTTLNILLKVLNDYAGPFNPNNVFLEKQSGLNPELANHMHKRIIGASEAGSQSINGNILKRVSGNDTITVERKGSNQIIEGIPQFTCWVATNSPPRIRGEDEAVIRRLVTFPFNVRISDERDDKNYAEKMIRDCRIAIIHWMLEGWVDYCKEGLAYKNLSAEIRKCTEEFNESLSDIGEFISETFEVAPRELPENALPKEWRQVKTIKAYELYKRWCEASGITHNIWLPKRFAREMARKGYKSILGRIEGEEKVVRVLPGLKMKDNRVSF